jgi:hypothetical protein
MPEEAFMKRNCPWILIAIAITILSAGYQPAKCAWAAAEVTLQVLNPRGEIALPPVSAPNARIADLAGKKLGLYWNEKPGGDHFWNGIEKLLKQRLPNTTVLRYQGAFDLGDALAAKMVKETDAFFYGVGD